MVANTDVVTPILHQLCTSWMNNGSSMRYDGCTTDIDDRPHCKWGSNVDEKYFFYEDKTLGHGATSEVHLGRNKLSFIAGVQITFTVTHKQKTGEHVAVKVVKKNFAPHTKRETELLEKLKHENIVKLIAVETHPKVLLRQHAVDSATDLWSFAITVLHCCNGKLPFQVKGGRKSMAFFTNSKYSDGCLLTCLKTA
ncbi:hypothetical protein CAPTEDRAFT_191633 [Capitella teleta]|uniref:Protein kinase domain-containing protein n=1 Tax=Capitella teleta TaxID=283909 RepID=R7T8Q4_CAPTE|nr:hypothetical protein CAPTEDRAFT_191633 [Capitella teleta]|eukprot:ELT89793.1 hypothetical protein CAPTEDRAFT_191633 [Capitella teleta]